MKASHLRVWPKKKQTVRHRHTFFGPKMCRNEFAKCTRNLNVLAQWEMPQIWAESQKNSKNLWPRNWFWTPGQYGRQPDSKSWARPVKHFLQANNTFSWDPCFFFFFFFFLLSQFSNLLSPASTIIAILNQNGPSKYVHKSIVTKCM